MRGTPITTQRRTPAILAAFVGCLLTLALAGCGGASGGSGSNPAIFTLGTTNYIDSLNPFVGYETQSYNAYNMLYPQLIQYNAKDHVVADWAKTWSANKAGTVWTFHVRAGSKWSDGTPLTAADAAWTGQLILRYGRGPTALLAGFLAGVKSFQAPNPTTLVVSYHHPVGDALAELVGFWVLPKHIWSHYVGAHGTGLKSFFPDQHLPVVAGGPYYISKYAEKGTTVFRANPYFYGPRSHVKVVALTYYTNATSMLADLSAGNLDAVDQIPFQAASFVKSHSDLVGWEGPSANIPTLLFNSNPAKPKNRELLSSKVKTALEYAIDRKSLVAVVWDGHAIPWANIVTSLSGSFVNQAVQPLPFDLAKANRILDSLGYKKGANGIRVVPATGGKYPQAAHAMSYSIAVPTDLDYNGDVAFQQIAANWQKIGVHVTETSPGDTSQAYAYFQGPNGTYKNYDIGLWYYAGYIDPNYILSILTKSQWGGWNDTGYSNPTYDALFDEQGTTVDQQKRTAIIRHMQEIINTDKPYIFLVNERWLAAYLHGWTGFNPELQATSKAYFTNIRKE